MAIQQFCQQAEELLDALRAALLACHPARIQESAAELEKLLASLGGTWGAAALLPAPDGLALARLRNKVSQLGGHLAQAANLCSGWAQLRLDGYTPGGHGVVASVEAITSYEA